MFGLKQKTVDLLDESALAALIQPQYDVAWYKDACASPIANIDVISNPMRQELDKKPTYFFGLYANHDGKLGRMLGARHFQFRSEYVLNCWVLKLSASEQLVILTGKGFGTSFEVAGFDGRSYPYKMSQEGADLLNQIIFSLNHILGEPIRENMRSRRSSEPSH